MRGPLSRFLLAITLVLAALPSSAQRVRVVVAVDLPELSRLSSQSSAQAVQSLRANVIGSLATATDVEPWGQGRAFAAEIDASELDALRRDPRVRAVSLDRGGQGALLESLPRIGVDAAHHQGIDGRGVTVAVLDTGIDVKNPDFSRRVVAEQCFCDNLDGTGCCPNGQARQNGAGAAADDNGHGTHVTGIIASDGSSGPRGVAPAAHIVAVKVMNGENSFKSFTQIYRALDWIARERPDVRVINMSLGSYALFSTRDCGSAAIAFGMRDVIDTLRSRGVLITASTGNQSSTDGTTLPSCMQEVVGVGATYDVNGDFNAFCRVTGARADQVTCFTNSTDAIDVVAPGALITASRRGGGAVIFAGTSMAAPHVAGAIALMQQASGGRMTAEAIEQILKTTGSRVTDPRNNLTFPRLDVAAALAATPRDTAGPRRRAARK